MKNKEISDETLGRLVIENIPRPAWIKSHDLIYVNYNKEFSNRFGKPFADSMLAKKDYELAWERYSEAYQTSDREVLSSEQATEYLNLVETDCHEHMVMVTEKTILRNISGAPIGILGTVNLLWPSASNTFRLLMELDNSVVAQSGYKIDQYILYENTIPSAENLTKKELICLFYLLRGASNKDISKLINISLRTVETHLEHIKSKLSCYSKSELISKAIELNMLRLIPKNIRVQDILVVKQLL